MLARRIWASSVRAVLRPALPRRWMSSKDEDFWDPNEFEDVQPEKTDTQASTPVADTLDPKNPPKLSYEHYQSLKGINFTDRAKLKQSRNEETEADWQQKLDVMRKETETSSKKYTTAQLSEIANHKIDVEKSADVDYAPMADSNLASSFGAGETDEFEYTTVPTEDFYDPGAFPRGLSMADMIPKKIKGKCIFCLPDPSKNRVKEITYTNVQLLHGFINERGMISSRRWNYNCSKHQYKLSMAIKQARFIGLLSFTDNFYAPESFKNFDFGDGSQLKEMELGLYDDQFEAQSHQNVPKRLAKEEDE